MRQIKDVLLKMYKSEWGIVYAAMFGLILLYLIKV